MNTTTERLSSLVGAIYDCVIDPAKWETTLAEVCSLTRFHGGSLAVNLLPSGELLLSAAVGYAPHWLATFNAYAGDNIRIWGGAERIGQYPLDEPVVCSRVTPRAMWPQNAFYREWARPQGLIDAVSIVLVSQITALGSVTFGRHYSAGEVTEPELELLRLIAPHLRRAVTISRLLDREAAAAATFAETIEALNVAVVLVDDDLRIVHANRQGREALAHRKSMRSDAGRLHLASPAATTTLRVAVTRASRNEERLGASGLEIPVGDQDDPSVAHVWPLHRRHIRGGINSRATVAVFVARAAVPPRLPGDALAVLYEFTPAECRIFELLVDGRTRAEIAECLGIAPSTVKTHVLRIFEKTGLHRQADLLKLAAALSLPTRQRRLDDDRSGKPL